MEYLANDIIRFKTDNNIIDGIIKAILKDVYYVRGHNTKEYEIKKSDILECMGRANKNIARSQTLFKDREK